MAAIRLNHVSISANDLDESVRFYTSVLGMERIATYTFAFPVQYLRLGDCQLHIFERPVPAPSLHHIGLDVDDFEGVYRRARELGILDGEAFFSPIYELPDGAVQLYLRDPAGNLIELDWPDIKTLDDDLIADIPKLADSVPQTPEGMRATLYHGGRGRSG